MLGTVKFSKVNGAVDRSRCGAGFSITEKLNIGQRIAAHVTDKKYAAIGPIESAQYLSVVPVDFHVKHRRVGVDIAGFGNGCKHMPRISLYAV